MTEEKEYHASYIVYEQAMLHIHKLTSDIKDRAEASLLYFNIMNSLKRSVQDAIEKEKKQIIDAYNAGQAKEASESFWSKGELYYDETYGRHT
jgi:hypothetical protein